MAKGKFEFWRTDDGHMLLESWARKGLTLDQIAKNMKIARSTLMVWIGKFSDISDAVKGYAKELADVEVENALRRRALGYTYVETTKERKLNTATGCFEMIITKEVTKQVLPDVTAQIYYLNNRNPAEWRNRREYAPEHEPVPDDGFIDALKKEAAEVMTDGGDTPENIDG